MVANIVNNEMEKKNIPRLDDKEESKGLEITYPRDTMIDSNEEKENLSTPRSKMDKEKEKLMIPRLEMGSNDVNNALREIGFV
jgi:hypothetical protein